MIYSNSFILLFEGVWFVNYPSSLPLRAVFPGASCGFPLGTSRCSRRSNVAFLEVYIVTPRPFRLKKFFAQNRFLARERRTCALQTTFFLDCIGPWRPRAQKSAVLYATLSASFKNYYKHRLKPHIPALKLYFVASRFGFVLH